MLMDILSRVCIIMYYVNNAKILIFLLYLHDYALILCDVTLRVWIINN